MLKHCKTIDIKCHKDERGGLVAIEGKNDIPFEIKRIYYIYGNDCDIRRGFHAHKNLKQLLICLHGECKIHLDDGENTLEVSLDDPTKGLIIGGCVWREMYDFTNEAVLLVLASEYYSEADYIRNYDEFIKYIRR